MPESMLISGPTSMSDADADAVNVRTSTSSGSTAAVKSRDPLACYPRSSHHGDPVPAINVVPLRHVRADVPAAAAESSASEVYTVELGVVVEGRGYLGIEEMVRVTADGVAWLTQRQMTMPLLGAVGTA